MVPFSRPSEWQYLEGTCHTVGHTWGKSCVGVNVRLSLMVCYEGFKLYLPLYLFSELVRGRSPMAALKVLPHVLRSSLFLGSNVTGALGFICLFRRLIGRFYFYLSVFVPCVLGTGCAILVERKSRRPLLAGYVATVALDLLYSILKHKKVISGLPYGEVLMFSTAAAVLFHKFRSHFEANDVIGSVLQGLMAPRLPALVTKMFRSSLLDNRLTHIFMVAAWAFLLGYFLQTVLSLLSQGRRLFKEKGKLRATITNSNNVKFAAFLSSLAAGFKLVNSILYYLPLPRDLRLALAGMAAGLSMLWYRSSPLALYTAWKALEVLYARGVSKGWWRYVPHGDVLIYALSTGFLFHGWFFEAHNMRWSYWQFLRRITWGRVCLLNFAELDKFGTGSSTRLKEWTDRSRREQTP